ncbi:type I restriction endonuclease subunit R [Deinococcus marmoris]|uniref:type I restriction endonuclease subunit R n=1 Tax=Deinococcus marmoris TaxID=249408 RepID=UPI001B80D4F4|nr:HsdR family type I site-specific deoxyribonuclease [Deinococcus marmoris]
MTRPEIKTQKRVIKTLQSLGYAYLGDWKERTNNRGIEEALLRENLTARGYTPAQIAQAVQKLLTAADSTGITLYQANLRTYTLLRYGVQVQVEAGAPHQTVHLIDWECPKRNAFAVAEEVTLKAPGAHQRRPDLVLYLNGLAVAVIELKRGKVEVADGVRQLITNQEPIFHKGFFSTVQLALAGNDTQGLRYGTVGTAEQFFVRWKGLEHAGLTKAPEADLSEGALLDGPVREMLAPARLLDLMRNFVIFDAGQKKVPRLHQFEGVKAAQERTRRREGGVIWHTQGSGKSILMVLLAKWLLEHEPDARILVVTDRDELDKQISGVMRNTSVISQDAPSPRITSRRELLDKLASPQQRLMCALLHKIDPSDLRGDLPRVTGQFYVFVDECHRTQGGDMNRQMRRWFPDAIFIGFTGTPLLRKDKQTTREVFGTPIHTYKFDEAVRDGVVLDLKYEARTVPQRLGSPQAVDQWFTQKTRDLNAYQRAVLRKRWANLEELMSSGERKSRIVANIIEDFNLRPRLISERGTAILVAASIYDACHYYRLFQTTELAGRVGLITSYQPNHNLISREPQGSDERYKFDTYTQQVLAPGQTTAAYEDEMKRRFIEEPANCKLLIVVSKLLTGFDAPSCTYLYLDQELRDHTLFQAICRTNRLDGEDKEYGHIVDYKELFENVQHAIAVYTSDELAVDEGGEDGNVFLKDWRAEGRSRLDAAWQELRYLCEPVPAPKTQEAYIHYFCGDVLNPAALADTEPLRIAFYKSAAGFLRAYAEVAASLSDLGYIADDIARLHGDSAFFAEVRASIKRASGEELDIKPYEQGMRHLINTYVQADHARDLGALSGLSLLESIVDTGINDVIAQQINRSGNLSNRAVAETIINNVRKTIIRDQLTDPRFYEEMSALLGDLIRQRDEGTLLYEDFLKETEDLITRLAQGRGDGGMPASLHGRREVAVLYSHLPGLAHDGSFTCPADDDRRAELALALDTAVRQSAPADWRGDETRERQIQNALFPLLGRDRVATRALFELLKHQWAY